MTPAEEKDIELDDLLDDNDIPDVPIWEFHITARDSKKAKRMRELLADNAPGTMGKAFRKTPIKITPRVQKNRMFAVDKNGKRQLCINLKTGEVAFVVSEGRQP